MTETRVPLRVHRRVRHLVETRARDGELLRQRREAVGNLSAGASCPGPIEGQTK